MIPIRYNVRDQACYFPKKKRLTKKMLRFAQYDRLVSF